MCFTFLECAAGNFLNDTEPITNYVITPHAAFEIKRRGLSKEMVIRVLNNPEQRVDVLPGRIDPQSRIVMENPKRTNLLRVFVDVDRDPVEVVTAYKTGVILDYDEAGNLVSLEILDASKRVTEASKMEFQTTE